MNIKTSTTTWNISRSLQSKNIQIKTPIAPIIIWNKFRFLGYSALPGLR